MKNVPGNLPLTKERSQFICCGPQAVFSAVNEGKWTLQFLSNSQAANQSWSLCAMPPVLSFLCILHTLQWWPLSVLMQDCFHAAPSLLLCWCCWNCWKQWGLSAKKKDDPAGSKFFKNEVVSVQLSFHRAKLFSVTVCKSSLGLIFVEVYPYKQNPPKALQLLGNGSFYCFATTPKCVICCG